MKYSELIALTQKIILSYNENIMTPDSHSQAFLQQYSKMQDTQKVFIKQIFYGCYRYKQFLKAFNNVLFKLYSSQTNRNDSTIFNIFTYIICFRLDQLPFPQFKKIVLSQNPVKMNVLFDLLFDIKKLKQHVRPEWSKCLDESYVDEKIIDNLQKKLQNMAQLIGIVCQRATGKKSDLVMSIESTVGMQGTNYTKKENKKGPTVFQPFNLTKPKVKLIPQPQKLQVMIKANPVPKSGKDLKLIQQEKNKRKQQIKQNIKKYYDQKQKQFNLETLKRPTNIDKIKQEVQGKRKEQMKFNMKYSRPMPKFNQVETKLNVAAILRQQKKLKEKIEQEQRKLKDLQINMRDEKQFQNWKKEMKQKDKYQELQNQQRRKIQMQLAREAAIKAYNEKIQYNKQLVQQMKQIAVQLKNERQQLQKQQLENKKKIVEQVNEQKQLIVQQREKVVQKNKKIHDQQKVQRKRILEKKKQEDQVQMQKKKQLIKEIKQLQKISKVKPKIIDENQTMGYGLLEEMSLLQLREKLKQVQQNKKKQEQMRRQQNLKKKQQFTKTINSKKDMILNHRAELSKMKDQQRLKKKKEQQQQKRKIQQLKIKSANQFKKREAQKLQKKVQQQEKLNKQIKQTNQKRQFLNQNQAAVEQNAFKNQQLGAQRQILNRQNEKLVTKQKGERIKNKQIKIIAQQAKKQIQEKVDFHKQYNENREQANKIHQMIDLQDKQSKATKYQLTKDYEMKHTKNMNSLNEYKSKINQLNLTKARQSSKKK